MKKKNLKLVLKKESISSLNDTSQKQVLGGNYPSAYTNCGGGGGGQPDTFCVASCSCTIQGKGIC